MNVERQVARSLRRVAFWRCVVEILDLPAAMISAVARMVNSVADVFNGVSRVAFLMELEAHRQYRLLTGIDLGVADGDDNRYAGMDAERNARMQSEIDGDA